MQTTRLLYSCAGCGVSILHGTNIMYTQTSIIPVVGLVHRFLTRVNELYRRGHQMASLEPPVLDAIYQSRGMGANLRRLPLQTNGSRQSAFLEGNNV